MEILKAAKPNIEIALAAPTGRAAERIHESSGLNASTIHILLQYTNIYGVDLKPKKNEQDPLDEDVVIIDEMSMVGIFLFQNLLKALKSGAKLILVGDWNQLPSIEPGMVLKDLSECHHLETFALKTIHRQSKDGRSIIT